MTKIKEINHQIHLLFQQYGIKSLTCLLYTSDAADEV